MVNVNNTKLFSSDLLVVDKIFIFHKFNSINSINKKVLDLFFYQMAKQKTNFFDNCS